MSIHQTINRRVGLKSVLDAAEGPQGQVMRVDTLNGSTGAYEAGKAVRRPSLLKAEQWIDQAEAKGNAVRFEMVKDVHTYIRVLRHSWTKRSEC